MSGDEVLACLASVVVSIYLWGQWYWRLVCRRLGVPSSHRTVLAMMPLGCAGVLFLVLRIWAAGDVREAPEYLFMYTVMGMAWLGVFLKIATFCGIDPLVDALDCRNAAVLAPSAGLMVGLIVCFAGGLASGSLIFCWLLLESLRENSPSEKITVNRDVVAGVRFAGLLVACGLIFGRAAAGDWVSAGATLEDFGRLAWPGFGLMIVFLVQEMVLPHPPSESGVEVVSTGVFPASAYLAATLGWLYFVGPW